MFNETCNHLGDSVPYTGPTYPVNSPYGFKVDDSGAASCPPGQVNDFDPATGQFSSLCVMDTAAYRAGGDGVNITPKPADAWTNYVIYGGIALLLFAMLKR